MEDSGTTTNGPGRGENLVLGTVNESAPIVDIPAADRSTLGEGGVAKTSRWPRTTRRQQRIRSVISRRQPTITVVLEDVHDVHNASAVLRSCDAIGVLDVHLVYVRDAPPKRAFHEATSASAAKWIRIRYHDSIESCFGMLRQRGYWIFATALRHESIDLYRLDLTQPTALVFGNEKRGVSSEAVELADGCVHIPMQGMVESLNVSVACAVSLYEVMRQRREAGMYERSQLDACTTAGLESDWLRR